MTFHSMLNLVLRAVHVLFHQLFTTVLWSIISSVLQEKKIWQREVKSLNQSSTA